MPCSREGNSKLRLTTGITDLSDTLVIDTSLSAYPPPGFVELKKLFRTLA